MKKVLFIGCFILSFGLSCNLFSQAYDSTRNNLSFDLIYGQKFYKNDFYKTLNNQNNISFGGNPRFIGVQEAGTIYLTKNHTWLRFNHYESFSAILVKMIPIDIKMNDSIDAKLSGFNLGFPVFGYDFLPNQKAIDLILIVGANTGRLKLYDNNLIRSHNPYFSPKITIFPRITIKRFTISILAEYEQDISKAGWKKMRFGKAGTVNVNGFDQTGYSFYFGLGYRIAEGTDKKDGD